MLLALTTAGRTDAVLQLTWAKVDFDTWTIDLREEKGVVNAPSKKARKGRALVPMERISNLAAHGTKYGGR